MKIFYSLCFLFCLCSCVHKDSFQFGTTVAYLIDSNEVFIAADSKSTDFDGTSKNVCKISKGNKSIWAKTGFVEYNKFKSESIISDEMNTNITFANKIEKINSRIHKEINPFLKKISHRNELSYGNAHAVIFSYIISSVENGNTVFDIRKYYLDTVNGKLDVTEAIVSSSLYGENKASYSVGVLGFNDSANIVISYLNSSGLNMNLKKYPVKVEERPNFKISSLGEFLYYLVYTETIKNKTYVGKPISVAKFSSGAFTWVENPLDCP